MNLPMIKTINKRHVAALGFSSVCIFVTALIFFGVLNNDFSFFNDYISKLGAAGEPNAIWFNLVGFIVVGVLLSVFGFAYGRLINDNLLGILLSLFGLGFAFTAIPMDMQYADTPVSKAHIVAICLGLACWLFGLSRLGYNKIHAPKIRKRANLTAVILVLSMIGFVAGFWSMPVTHRLVFGIVFGWTAISSADLLISKKTEDDLYY